MVDSKDIKQHRDKKPQMRIFIDIDLDESARRRVPTT